MDISSFRDVVGYEQYFSVSSTGEVWSKRSRKLLKLNLRPDGGLTLATKIGGRMGRSVCLKVHRLVAEAWISNPENKPFVNHIDGVRSNNSVENLEWVTASENVIHAYSIGLNKGIIDFDNPMSSFAPEDLEYIRKSTLTQRALAEMFGVEKTAIGDVLRGKTYKNV